MATNTITTIHAIRQARYTLSTMRPNLFFIVSVAMFGVDLDASEYCTGWRIRTV